MPDASVPDAAPQDAAPQDAAPQDAAVPDPAPQEPAPPAAPAPHAYAPYAPAYPPASEAHAPAYPPAPPAQAPAPAAGGAPARVDYTTALERRVAAAVSRGIGHVTRRTLGSYQTAVVRIGFAATMLAFLLREWPNRDELYGPGSPWGFDLATQFANSQGSFSVLLWSDSGLWFQLFYHFALLSCVGMLLGWRTRASSMMFLVSVLSLQNRSIFMGDGGDNVIHLMALYLALTRCGRVWSLDARRRARGGGDPADPVGVAVWAALGLALFLSLVTGKLDSPVWTAFFGGMWVAHAVWWAVRRRAPGEPRIVCDMLGNLVHNAALLVIMAEVCLIYATAGWYKIQGSRWEDGTAVYYPMNLDYFNPWPELTDLLAGNGTLVTVMSYGTVFVQVGFVFALLNRKAKNVLLVAMIGEHLGIALLMGLPFFSLAMIAMDSVFLPTAFLLWLGSRLGRGAGRLGGGEPAPAAADLPGEARPPQPAEGPRPAWAERG
nr:HTTM domain-containing protein [Streptomyces hoynatensis]